MTTSAEATNSRTKANLAIADQRVDAQRDIAGERNTNARYMGLVESLSNKDSPWAASQAAWNKQQQAKIAAISKYRSALGTGMGREKIKAFVDLTKLLVKTEVDLAKLGTTADTGVMKQIQDQTGLSWGDRDALGADRDKARLAWQVFYNIAPRINSGAVLAATKRKIEQFYGSPNDAALGADDGLQSVRMKIDAMIEEADRSAAGAYGQMRELTKRYEAGEDVPETELSNLLQHIPGLATPQAIAAIEQDVINEKPPETLDPLEQKRQDFLEKELADLKAGRNKGADGAPMAQDNEKHAWLAAPKAQEWAKDNGLQVGRFEPVPADPAARKAFDAKYPNAVLTKNGMYIQGPDDDKAALIARRQINTRPEQELFRLAGLGRNTGRRESYIEFEVPGDAGGTKKHADGAWYFETTADGQKVYLSEEELAGRKTDATVTEFGTRDDGAVLLKLSDGTYVYSGDGETYAAIPAEAGQKLAARMTIEPADGKVSVPDGIGVQKTTTPPQGAVQTVRGIRDPMRLTDPAGSRAIIDSRGERIVYEAPKNVRTVSGGEDKKTVGEMIGGARVKGQEKAEQKRIGENEDIGDAPRRGGSAFNDPAPGSTTRGRREQVNAIRESLPIVPDAATNEDLTPRPSTDAAVKEFSQRARTSDGNDATTTKLEGARGEPGKTQLLLTPRPGPNDPNPVARARVASPDGAGVAADPPARAPAPGVNVRSTTEAANERQIQDAIDYDEPGPTAQRARAAMASDEAREKSERQGVVDRARAAMASDVQAPTPTASSTSVPTAASPTDTRQLWKKPKPGSTYAY